MPRAQDLIAQSYRRIIAEVAPLTHLKTVIRLELRGRGDVQIFRVRTPGPDVTKEEPDDAKLDISIPRSDFNELAENGGIEDWRDAIETGVVRISGDRDIEMLVVNVVERHLSRGQHKRSRR
ncbi:MAG: hypothetical protein ACR2N5_06540 [Solirubrobacterales bacterium]